MKIEAYVNDEAEELLMNLTAQGYYGEAWELVTKLTMAFQNGLYLIVGRAIEDDR